MLYLNYCISCVLAKRNCCKENTNEKTRFLWKKNLLFCANLDNEFSMRHSRKMPDSHSGGVCAFSRSCRGQF